MARTFCHASPSPHPMVSLIQSTYFFGYLSVSTWWLIGNVAPPLPLSFPTCVVRKEVPTTVAAPVATIIIRLRPPLSRSHPLSVPPEDPAKNEKIEKVRKEFNKLDPRSPKQTCTVRKTTTKVTSNTNIPHRICRASQSRPSLAHRTIHNTI